MREQKRLGFLSAEVELQHPFLARTMREKGQGNIKL